MKEKRGEDPNTLPSHHVTVKIKMDVHWMDTAT